MKKYILILLVMLSVGYVSFKAGKWNQKSKNLESYGYAAEWGCLTGGKRGCDEIKDEIKKYDCYDYMRVDFCPKAHEAFKRFMSQSY